MSVNRAELLGRVGADPDVRRLPSGEQVATVRLATSEHWTDRAGERQQSTEWHRVVLWAGLAELAAQYVRKGRELYVEGKIKSRRWQNAQGERRTTVEIVATSVQLIGRPASESAAEPTEEPCEITSPDETETSTDMAEDVAAALEESWTADGDSV